MRYQLDTSGGAPPLLIAQIELAVSQLARALGADTLGGILADVLVTSERDELASELIALARDALGEVSPEFTLDRCFEADERKRFGMFMTPLSIAQGLAAMIPEGTRGCVMDLSAGSGALVYAAASAHPSCSIFAVERSPALASACALWLIALRVRQGQDPRRDRVVVGDGLSAAHEPPERVEVVLGNPPYVGEKGQRELFERLKREHPDLASNFAPRMDLLYLFMHRALDWLEPGGRMIYLTSEYWLQATSASKLRADLLARAAPELFFRVDGTKLFDDAPGHHSLVFVASRRARGQDDSACRVVSLAELPRDWPSAFRGALDVPEADALRLGDEGWFPFADSVEMARAAEVRERWARLGDVVCDRQGFVSGLDRVGRSHRRKLGVEQGDGPALGAGVFVLEAQEVTPELSALRGDYLKPLVRGSSVRAGSIMLTSPGSSFALYVDGAIEDERDRRVVEAHLESVKPLLEQRREVRAGGMPWYRLHWPRRRAEQLGPKIVCARRGAGLAFGLDLSGAVVSSDCTYLVLARECERPIEALVRILVALHLPEMERDLEVFGKRKGELFEFYSQPLRDMPLPLVFADGVFMFDSSALGSERVDALEEVVSRAMVVIDAGRVDRFELDRPRVHAELDRRANV